MRQAVVQVGMVLALIELAEYPVEKVAGLACADGQVSRPHIEKMHWVRGTEGDALGDRGRDCVRSWALRRSEAIAEKRQAFIRRK